MAWHLSYLLCRNFVFFQLSGLGSVLKKEIILSSDQRGPVFITRKQFFFQNWQKILQHNLNALFFVKYVSSYITCFFTACIPLWQRPRILHWATLVEKIMIAGITRPIILKILRWLFHCVIDKKKLPGNTIKVHSYFTTH